VLQILKTKGARTDLLSNLTKSNPIHVREEVAEKVGVSSGQLYKIEKFTRMRIRNSGET